MSAKRFQQLKDDLYTRSPESRDRVAAKVEQLNEQLRLAQLRARSSKTQTEIAEAIGTTQSAVSRIEHQDDLLVSSLNDYVSATGGRLRLIAEYDADAIEIDLPALHEAATPERVFRVVWQNQQTRKLLQVGWLTAHEGYTFAYTVDAELDADFEPFPPFPDFRREYRSADLFAFFADRIATASRGDVRQLAVTLGVPADQSTPIELLARSWGRSTHDTLQVVPVPNKRPDGVEVMYFLASGVRHVNEHEPERIDAVIADLSRDVELTWSLEPDNPVNDRAIRLEHQGRHVGWMPDYLLDDIHKAEPLTPRVYVEHTNGPDVPWHLRLLCRLELTP